MLENTHLDCPAIIPPKRFVFYDTDTDDEDDSTTAGSIDSWCDPPSSLNVPLEWPDTECRIAYFMDGQCDFTSILPVETRPPILAHVAHIFETWLANKLQTFDESYLPILQDAVGSLAEDIAQTFSDCAALSGLVGLDRLRLKVRTGHIYTYQELDDAQPVIPADLQDFVQRFPLFIEITIHTMAKTCHDPVCLLSLAVENVTVSPGNETHITKTLCLPCAEISSACT